jgi:hypothetical protein
MANISWAVTVQVDGRVAMSAATAATTVEATESLQVTIEPGDTDKVVDLMPGAGDAVHILAIKSTFYGAEGEKVSFKASDGTNDSDPVTLSSPQAYTRGSVALFGLDPNQLKFTNTSTTKSADVAIFVARDATP